MTISSPDAISQYLQTEYGLDEFQVPAANHLSGPALVLACAGSGKTTCLTARVTHLIRHHHVPAEQILCITFTNKATENMVHKITAKIGANNPLPTISTIHSLGLSIIRKYPLLAIEALAELAGVTHIKDDKPITLTIWSERNCGTTFRKICEENSHVVTRMFLILLCMLAIGAIRQEPMRIFVKQTYPAFSGKKISLALPKHTYGRNTLRPNITVEP
jgi:UvrD/REP helicase N-terminal domain